MAKKLLRKTKKRRGTKRLSRVKKGGVLIELESVIQKPNKVSGPSGRDASTLRGSKELFQQWADRQFSSDPENQQKALYSLQVENSGSRFTFYYKSVRNEWYKVILQGNRSIEEMMKGMSLNENTFNVKTLSGDIHPVYYERERKMGHVVDEVASILGVMPTDFHLVSKGNPASYTDNKYKNSTLSQLNINKGTTLHVILRLRGGITEGGRRKKRTRKKRRKSRRKSRRKKRRRKKRTKRRR